MSFWAIALVPSSSAFTFTLPEVPCLQRSRIICCFSFETLSPSFFLRARRFSSASFNYQAWLSFSFWSEPLRVSSNWLSCFMILSLSLPSKSGLSRRFLIISRYCSTSNLRTWFCFSILACMFSISLSADIYKSCFIAFCPSQERLMVSLCTMASQLMAELTYTPSVMRATRCSSSLTGCSIDSTWLSCSCKSYLLSTEFLFRDCSMSRALSPISCLRYLRRAASFSSS